MSQHGVGRTYYLLTCGEDGFSIQRHDETSLRAVIRDYGQPLIFLDKLPAIDKGCWRDEHAVIVIKGEIIVPQAKQVVTEYEF